MRKYRLTHCPETGDISFECSKCVNSEAIPTYDTYNRPFIFKAAHPGECQTCSGHGYILENICPSCEGSGICTTCNGKPIRRFRELPSFEQELWREELWQHQHPLNPVSNEANPVWLSSFREW